MRLVKGSHIIVPKFWSGDHAYLVQNHDKRVIFINPYEGDKALIDEGKKWGLNNFLAKPFTVPALKTCIEAVVGKLT